jgi:hypothetical protein
MDNGTLALLPLLTLVMLTAQLQSVTPVTIPVLLVPDLPPECVIVLLTELTKTTTPVSVEMDTITLKDKLSVHLVMLPVLLVKEENSVVPLVLN